MIDLHCHVLPGIDDGPDSVEEALALVRQAHADGIETIAATPHVDETHSGNTGARVRAGIAALLPQLQAAGLPTRIVPGGELDALHAVGLSDAELDELKLGGGPYLLLECPLSPLRAPAFLPAARSLVARGHQLLLAHPERSPVFLKQPQLLGELVAEGMLAQVTAGALSGVFGRTVRACAHALLEQRVVHVAASDAHGRTRQATIARELAEAEIDPDLAHWLTEAMPAAVLAGELPPAPPAPASAPGKGRLKRLFGA